MPSQKLKILLFLVQTCSTAMLENNSATDKQKTIHSTALKGTMHSAQNTTLKLTNHRLKKKEKKIKNKKTTTTKNFLVPPLSFSPLPLPRQAEPKQKSQHEKKKPTKISNKFTNQRTLFFRLQSETDFSRVIFSSQTERMETTSISHALNCSPKN